MEHVYAIGDRVRRAENDSTLRNQYAATIFVIEAFDDGHGLPGYIVRPEAPTPSNKNSRFIAEQFLVPADSA